MVSNNELIYNERAWGIDLISKINIFTQQRHRAIVRAGGEHSLHSNKERTLFPDVLLFGDSYSGIVRQGWELKTPETSVYDKEVIDNAVKKAKRLGTNSFLIWNVNKAVLYKLENDDTVVLKEWKELPIYTRKDIKENEKLWSSLLEEILNDLNDFFDKGYISSAKFENAINADFISKFISQYEGITADNLKKDAARYAIFEAEVTDWWLSSKSEYEKDMDKFLALSRFIITNWINKLIFAHYLKTYHTTANEIDKITDETSIDDALKVCDYITSHNDFLQIFDKCIGSNKVGNETWMALCQLNMFLVDYKLNLINQELLQNTLEQILNQNRRKIAGQYCTPPNLAKLLANILIDDRTKTVYDPCCGTGTIVKEVYNLKRSKGISVENCLDEIWASDKFQFPLQLCTLSLASAETMGKVLKVFNSDIFNVKINNFYEFTNPNTAKKDKISFQSIDYIISNLPFIRFEKSNKFPITYNDKNITTDKKSDYFAYILYYLKTLLKKNGKIGIICSNSWLGTDWGETFKKNILNLYSIEKIIISNNGKWFSNADIVTTILILSNKKSEASDTIDFISTNLHIDDWSGEVFEHFVSSINLGRNSDYINIQRYTYKELGNFQKWFSNWMPFFVDLSWFKTLSAYTCKANQFLSTPRGIRRGCNEFFYPVNTDSVDDVFLYPLLKSSSSLEGLEAVQDKLAFCCSLSEEELKAKNYTKTLNWIQLNKAKANKLKQKNLFWYELKFPKEQTADFVLSTNPDKRLFIAKTSQTMLIDQRLLLLKCKKDKIKNVNLLHALLNSTLGMFFIETSGFGRGLGALDLNSTKLKRSFLIWNPQLIENKSEKILKCFDIMKKRKVLTVNEELRQQDRINLDKAILEAYGIDFDLNLLYNSLLKLYNIRQSVHS